MLERLKLAIEWTVFIPVRIRHRSRARPKQRVRAGAIATTRKTLASAKGLKAASTQSVFNVGLYLLLLDQDLADFTDDMVSAVGDRKRRFVAKHEAVLLREAAEDLTQLLGKRFRDAVRALDASPGQQKRLDEASAGLNQFWRRRKEFLEDIRQALAAHREHDALLYAEKLDALRPLEVMELAAEFSVHLEKLIAILVELAELTIGPASILNDMRRSAGKEAG